MDKTKERTRLEEILAEWDMSDCVTHFTLYSSPQNSITITDSLNTTSMTSPYTVTAAIGGTYPSGVVSNVYATGTNAPWLTSNPTGARIQLDGEDADIRVRGWSLVDAVKRIEERLGLYQPNPELEKEWEDLRALADKYKKLEQHIKDKQATFDRLKAMPAPEVD